MPDDAMDDLMAEERALRVDVLVPSFGDVADLPVLQDARVGEH